MSMEGLISTFCISEDMMTSRISCNRCAKNGVGDYFTIIKDGKELCYCESCWQSIIANGISKSITIKNDDKQSLDKTIGKGIVCQVCGDRWIPGLHSLRLLCMDEDLSQGLYDNFIIVGDYTNPDVGCYCEKHYKAKIFVPKIPKPQSPELEITDSKEKQEHTATIDVDKAAESMKNITELLNENKYSEVEERKRYIAKYIQDEFDSIRGIDGKYSSDRGLMITQEIHGLVIAVVKQMMNERSYA